MTRPLLGPRVTAAVREAATGHRGRTWACTGFTDLTHRASHPCGIFSGTPFPEFAKLDASPLGRAQFTAERAGLRLIRERPRSPRPCPSRPALLRAYAGAAPRFDAAGFTTRRELWRLPAYLAVIAADGASPFGRSFLPRLAAAVRRYA